MVVGARGADDAGMGDSFSVDTAALGTLPDTIEAARTALGAVRIEAASRAAEAACGSSAGSLGVNAVGNAMAHLVDVGMCALGADVERLRRTVANYDTTDRAAADGARRCTASLAGGWW